MPVLMKDVAERAGVSLTTASLVLSRSDRISISAETRRRVLETARALNYRPNENARRLAQRATNSVGLIISEISNPFFPEIIQSFERAAKARGFELLLANTEYDPERAVAATKHMIDNKVRGVAVLTSKFERSLVRELTSQRIAAVVVDRKLAAPGASSVEIDFARGLEESLDHVLNLGHRRFAAITGPHTVGSAVRYWNTLERLFAARRLELSRIIECNYRHEGGMEAIRSLVAERPMPTAVFCGNDLIALGAISVLKQMGNAVPEDMSVIGFDDIVFARLAAPPLTTVSVPREELGRVAFDALYALQKSKRRKAEAYTVPTRLIVRQSTAPARPQAEAGALTAGSGTAHARR
jgi:LacI family transcriptional regulator